MNFEQSPELFGVYYFLHGCRRPYQRNKEWLDFFENIAEHIVQRIQPHTVLDAGCAMGFLVEGLRKRGVQAFGVDISEHAIQNVHRDIQPYCWVGSITDQFPQRYDLIVSIEVVEHLPKPHSERAIANLCRYTDDILFSSTPADYKEATHFNVQPPEYWAELFARQGYFRDVDFDASFITPWAARFHRTSQPLARVVRDYERRFWLLWKENFDLRQAMLERNHQLETIQEQMTSGEKELSVLRAQIQQLNHSPESPTLHDLAQESTTAIDKNETINSSSLAFRNKLKDIFKAIPVAVRLYQLVLNPAKIRTNRAQRLENRRQGGLPIPPGWMLFLVQGSEDVGLFLHTGKLAVQSIRETLAKQQVELESLEAILDFGCGAGRVIRWWESLKGPKIFGVDIHPRLIHWCKANLPFADYQVNKIGEKLAFQDEQFDFIYALSVFTHLSEKSQFFWMAELTRVLKPGGYLLITTHGEPYVPQYVLPEDQPRFANGELIVYCSNREGSNLCRAYHPQRYLREKLAAGLALVDFIPQGALGNPNQDVVLFRKATPKKETIG